jgi:NitT/TauT family transport system substrate-binding protein
MVPEPVPARRLSRARVLALTGVTAVTVALPFAGSAQALKPVRTGASLSDGLTPVLYGIHAGLYARVGLDIRLESSESGAALAQAVAGRAIDVANSSLMSLITAYARGITFKLIAGGALYSSEFPTTQLCVLRDSPIKTAADLSGKTIVVNALQSLDMIATESLIDRRGGNSATVKFIELPAPAMFNALEQGRADMAAITNPSLADALATGKVRTFAPPYAGIGDRLLIAGWFCTADYAERNPDVVEKFAAATREAALYTNAHHAETLPLLAAYAHLDPDIIKRMNRLTNATSLDVAYIQPAIDAAVKYRVIDKGFPASDLIASRRTGTRAVAQTTILRVGSVPVETAVDIFYAQEQGFFKDAGFDAEIEVLANGQNLLGAVSGGTYDIATISTVAIAVARERGIPVRLIAPNSTYLSSAPTDLLMVAQNSSLHTARDLAGKTIAVSGLANMSFVAVRAWIAKNGGDLGTIRFVEFPMPAMAEALQLGRVDAAMMNEPFITSVKDVARPLASPYDAIARRFMTGGWFATDAWLQQHTDTAKRFVGAMRRAHDWANAHPKESAAILVRHTKLTPELVARMTRAVFGTTLDPQLIQPVLDVAAASGMLPHPLAASDLIWVIPSFASLRSG